jgi:hypothetical protein
VLDYQEKAWELMTLCCSTFPPSHMLLKYLAAFLQEEINKKAKFATYADYASRELKGCCFYGPRNLVPCVGEMASIKARGTYPITVLFMDVSLLYFC